MRGLKTSLSLAALTLSVALAVPASPTMAAPANVAAAVARKDRPEEAVKLDAARKPTQVLGFLGLEKGARILDIATGSGYYAEIIARAAGPKSVVLGWEPAGFYGEGSAKKWVALRSRVPNARLMVGEARDFALAPESFDFVLLHMVYHDFYGESAEYHYPRFDPDVMLNKIFAATKPGGIVGVVDHVANPGGDTREVVEKLHRIDPAIIRADFERAGFVFDGESDLLRNPADDHSLLVFDPAIQGKTDRIVYRFKKPG